MAEYIEREAAKRAVDDAMELTSSEYDVICNSLDSVPAADVAPVVRCKNCVHSYASIFGYVCSKGPCVDCDVPENFWCAYGARMDGDSDALD